MRNLLRALACTLLLAALPPAAEAGVFVGVSVNFAPPPLPVYVQPPCPAPGFVWTPGYWAWGPDGYFWVPGTWLLAPGMADFNLRHPAIRLDLITASGFLNPSKREADMAVMLGRPQKGRLQVRRLGNYQLHLYASPAYLDRAGLPGSTTALRRHILIGYVPEFIFSPELHYLDEVEAGLEAHLRSTSINIQHRMIAEGAGIGVLPDFIGQQDRSLVPILPDLVEITRSFWLVIHSDLRKLPRIEAVADWLQQRVDAMSAAAPTA